MASTHKIKDAWSDGSQTIAYEVRQTGGVVASLDLSVAAGTRSAQSAIAIVVSALQSLYIASSQPATVAINGTDAVKTLTVTGTPATGDTFRLTFGSVETADILLAAPASAVQAALRLLSTIGPDGVSVTGPAGGPWRVEFVGALANQPVGALIVTGPANTSGAGVAVANTVTGVGPSQTISLKAGVPIPWHKDSFHPCPLTGDVSKVSVTVAAGLATATVQLRALSA